LTSDDDDGKYADGVAAHEHDVLLGER